MKFRYISGSPLDVDADLVAISVHEDPEKDPAFKAADAALGGRLRTRAGEEEFAGKLGQTLLIDRPEGGRLLVLGAGARDRFKVGVVRDLAARAVKTGSRMGARRVVFGGPAAAPKLQEAVVQHAVEGALLGAYRFGKYLSKDESGKRQVEDFAVAPDAKAKPGAKGKNGKGAAPRGFANAIARGEAVAQAICAARDFVNEPAGTMTPSQLAEEARTLAKQTGLKVKVMGRKECEKLGMGMFLAVGRASAEEPQFIHLTYTPKKKAKKRVVLVGKGVTFDSGGLSLKPSSAMEDMKLDMAGAAAVIAAMGAIARIGSDYEVHALAACCENMVAGNSYKLGDVLRSMDGTTVEINNTDAEGRLTLGDAITFARTKLEPDEIIDVATLTGACMIALGPWIAGVMGDDDGLVGRWLAAAEAAGEDMWRLPLMDRMRDHLKSSIADMRNTGERYGGAISAGLFLKTFAKDVPWVHVDIAGPSFNNSEQPTTPRGGTGFAVATIVEYITR